MLINLYLLMLDALFLKWQRNFLFTFDIQLRETNSLGFSKLYTLENMF